MIKQLLSLFCGPAEKSNLRLQFTILFMAFVFSGSMNAQVATQYSVSQLPGATYTDLTTKTIIFGGAWDNPTPVLLSTGFTTPFKFNGVAYPSGVYVSPNGFLTLGAATSTTNYTPISNLSTTYAGAISAFGANLSVATAEASTPQKNSISYYLDTTGGINNYILKIEYRDWRVSTSESTYTSMQIWLYETTNVIEFRYKEQPSSYSQNQTGQIGLRGPTNSDFNNLSLPSAAGAVWPAAPGTMAAGTVNSAIVAIRSGSASITAGANRLFRWVPSDCSAPTSPVVSGLGNDQATVTWTGSAASGFEYYITTSATPPNSSTVAIGSTTGTNTNLFSGLTGGTFYYAYIRANCGSGIKSTWLPVTFQTLCSAQNIDYHQRFTTTEPGYNYAIPAIPPCSNVSNEGTGNVWITEAGSAAVTEGFTTDHLVYPTGGTSGSQPANTWFYTQGVNLTSGTSYRISYRYGGSSYFSFLTNVLEVRYASAPNASAMNAGSVVANHNTIKSSPMSNAVNFIPSASGVYYFGFHAASIANQGKIFLDDIEVTLTSCFAPTGLMAGTPTTTSALINWLAPSNAPASGYQYYYTTSNTFTPDGTTVPSGSSTNTLYNLTGLTASTTYYIWVRSNCGSGDFSDWSTRLTITTAGTSTATYCTPSASSQDGTGITNVTMGSISNNTGRETGGYGNFSSQTANVIRNTTVPVSITLQTGYAYDVMIWVDWNNDGDFVDAGESVYTGAAPSTNPYTLSASFNVPAAATLGVHRLRIGGVDHNFNGGIYPVLSSCRVGAWQVFEDYSIFVTDPVAALTLSSNAATICLGTSTSSVSVTAGTSDYDVYLWSPSSGVSALPPSTFTFNPNTPTTYTLTAFSRATGKSNTTSFTVKLNQPPTSIVLTPSASATVCQGQTAQMISSTGGITSGETVLIETFNNATFDGWTQVNNSTGGSPAAAAWGVVVDGYSPPYIYWNESLHSNDNSPFAFTNSDAQLSGSTTQTSLFSPVFSLAAYTTATLNFFHYFRLNGGGDKAEVAISKNGGAWVPLRTYTSTQGSASNFANVAIDLGAYVGPGNENLQIRFKYDATWDYGWAIDNFKISGSATSSIKWSPIAGLFLDSALNTPYTAGTGAAVVYALPATSTTYTATASSGLGCETTTSTSINVTPISGGTVTTANQSVCGGSSASAVATSGIVGTVLYWQHADDSLFTVNLTNIPGSAGLTTLTPALIGTQTTTLYYRAVINVGGCNNAFSTVHTISVPSTTYSSGSWNNGVPNSGTQAIISSNYTMAANMNMCSLKITGGDVIVNPGVTLSVENAVDVSGGGTLTFENGSSLLQTNTGNSINTGNIAYKRDSQSMVAYDYTYWSSPVKSQTLAVFSPNTRFDKYMTWDPVSYNWSVIAAPALTLMAPGVGYIMRAPSSFTATPQAYPGNFTGIPNNGDITTQIYVNPGDPAKNVNLIGNPYASALDAEKLMKDPANAASLGGGTTLYFWTHNHGIANQAYNDSDYATYNYTGGTGTTTTVGIPGRNPNIPNKYIAAGQAFMVSGIGTGYTNVVFKNTMRVGGGNNLNFFKSQSTEGAPEKNRIWLELKNDGSAYKQLLIGYIEGATNAFDNGYDGVALESGTSVSFYSLLSDETKLTTQGKALPFNDADRVPLGYKAATAGSYEINMPEKDGLFDSQTVYLEDRLLQVVHNLSAGSYAFATDAGTFNERFVVKYVNIALNTNDLLFNENAVVVYKDHNGVNIKTKGFKMDNVKIYDVKGSELVGRKDINSDTAVISNLPATQQVLLVKVVSDQGIVVTKKIVF